MPTKKTMRGLDLDLELLRKQNENKVALGNSNKNARGDILDSNRNVVVKKEQINQAYYANNPNSVKSVTLSKITPDIFQTPEEISKMSPDVSTDIRLRKKVSDRKD